MPIAASWIQLEIIILNELSQRTRNTILYHFYVKLKYDTVNLSIEQNHRCREQTCSGQGGGEGGEGWTMRLGFVGASCYI